MKRLVILLIMVCTCQSFNAAEKNKSKAPESMTPMPTLMVEENSVLLFEDFSQGMPRKPVWNKSLKGEWTIKDDALTGFERPTDHHAGVFMVNVEELPAASVVRMKFRLTDKGAIGIMAQGKNQSGEPCVWFRVAIDKNGVRIGTKTRGWDYTASTKQNFEENKWYHITVEIGDDEVIAWTDEDHISYVKHAVVKGFRNGISLRTYGINGLCYFDDVKLSSGVIKPEWEAMRSKLAANIK